MKFSLGRLILFTAFGAVFLQGMIFQANLSMLIPIAIDYEPQWWRVIVAVCLSLFIILGICFIEEE